MLKWPAKSNRVAPACIDFPMMSEPQFAPEWKTRAEEISRLTRKSMNFIACAPVYEGSLYPQGAA